MKKSGNERSKTKTICNGGHLGFFTVAIFNPAKTLAEFETSPQTFRSIDAPSLHVNTRLRSWQPSLSRYTPRALTRFLKHRPAAILQKLRRFNDQQ